ncbi:MAG TPA: UDP-N-acetylmuramoyl-L-alanine--D-glutamate ligase [Anaerolineales bacterium]|nr:UDP-N-acetylmuramoyl-L-alanine--D-glutamate ligase [Anaerolineales bacterium]
MNQDWQAQRVVIIGAARQGLALAAYLLKHNARVTITDRRSPQEMESVRQQFMEQAGGQAEIEWVFGDHPLSLLDRTDWLAVSGGVPLTNPLVQAATERGIRLTNDSQIFLEAAPCRVVGITGSAGKTTTTSLVGEIARAARQPGQVWVGGNIGKPLISSVDEMKSADLAVMELSSFQLELMHTSPQIAAVLNITPNHLDRHVTMAAYTAAKTHILAHQTDQDIAVLGREDPGSRTLTEKVAGRLLTFGIEKPQEKGFSWEGTYLTARGELHLQTVHPFADLHLFNREAILLRGEHNLMNVLAACAIAAAAELPIAAMQTAVGNFRGVPHRLEFVRSWQGADWFNDSIATAPERSMAAIRAFEEPLILLAGGKDKDLPWDEFAMLVAQRVDHIVVFGEAAEKIFSALQACNLHPDERGARPPLTISRCKDLRAAIHVAAELVEPGDVVLLSPGGTSFDEFRDFEERGQCFSRWVKDLH